MGLWLEAGAWGYGWGLEAGAWGYGWRLRPFKSPVSRPSVSGRQRPGLTSIVKASCPIAFWVASATPEGIACVASLVGNQLFHGTSAFGTCWHVFICRLLISHFKSSLAHAFRKTAFLTEVIGNASHLTMQQAICLVNQYQNRICRINRILRLEETLKPISHGKNVFAVIMTRKRTLITVKDD